MLKSVFRRILNFLLPPRCICCGQINGETDGICPSCFNKITFISAPYCRRCGQPFEDTSQINRQMLCPNCLHEKHHVLDLSRSAVRYNEASKGPIIALKFSDRTENAKIFARWLKMAGQDIFDRQPDLLIPVPLHYLRRIRRRYNQSALLAVELGKLTGIETDTRSLIKCRATKPQGTLSGKARLKNLKGVFKVRNPENIRGKRIVLIDDVRTTGATLTECAKALRSAGAVSVDALTVARV